MGEPSNRSRWVRGLFFFSRSRANEAARASASRREGIQNRIDETQRKLREKLETLERFLRRGSSRED
jgi:hypothetical protein